MRRLDFRVTMDAVCHPKVKLQRPLPRKPPSSDSRTVANRQADFVGVVSRLWPGVMFYGALDLFAIVFAVLLGPMMGRGAVVLLALSSIYGRPQSVRISSARVHDA